MNDKAETNMRQKFVAVAKWPKKHEALKQQIKA